MFVLRVLSLKIKKFNLTVHYCDVTLMNNANDDE